MCESVTAVFVRSGMRQVVREALSDGPIDTTALWLRVAEAVLPLELLASVIQSMLDHHEIVYRQEDGRLYPVKFLYEEAGEVRTVPDCKMPPRFFVVGGGRSKLVRC